MTLQDVFDALDTVFVTKNQDGTDEIHLAWYSTRDHENTYHVCLNCGQYGGIQKFHFAIATELSLTKQGYKMCRYCYGRIQRSDDCCDRIFLVIKDA